MAEPESPRLRMRGTIEGFYGPPWTHEQRLAHLAFSADVGLDSYVYAPKHDPRHRLRWRERYPAAELARIAELAARASELGVRFVFALHPALDMRFGDDADHATLAAKAGQLFDAGVRSFALLFDDVPYQLPERADAGRFGDGQTGTGAAHGHAVTRFVADFLRPRGIREPLLVCPTDYAGVDDSPYRQAFADSAPADVLITWTGPHIVSAAITRADAERAVASYRRPVVLWDNFPVNDYDPSRLFLGPLTGRDADLPVAGVVANAMIEARPSRIALGTVADWSTDPAGYDPAASAEKALDRVAQAGADDLRPLVRACSGWPPSADHDAELSAATQRALAGDAAALDETAARLTELKRCCAQAREPQPLVTQLRPWLASAIATADAGLAAVDLLRRLDEGTPVDGRHRETERLLTVAESRYHDVLRPVVHPFVRAVLARATPHSPATDARPVAVVAGGPVETDGEATTVRFLDSLGFAASRVTGGAAEVPSDARVVVVTPGTSRDELPELAMLPVPLVAWSGFVPLRLASRSATAVLWDGLTIIDPDDSLAAGYRGTVGSHRGPGWIITGAVGAHARVVARAREAEQVALFRYAPGDPLADGTPAPATRVGLFLSDAGPARWLMSEAGLDLVRAAFAVAVPATVDR